jgi:hypothetical protein
MPKKEIVWSKLAEIQLKNVLEFMFKERETQITAKNL